MIPSSTMSIPGHQSTSTLLFYTGLSNKILDQTVPISNKGYYSILYSLFYFPISSSIKKRIKHSSYYSNNYISISNNHDQLYESSTSIWTIYSTSYNKKILKLILYQFEHNKKYDLEIGYVEEHGEYKQILNYIQKKRDENASTTKRLP